MNHYETKLRELLLEIPKGKITTYGELARAMNTKGYRFVGQLLHRNPYPDKFPCYKVVRSDGSLGGFALGCKDKVRRLKADGIEVKKNKIIGFEKVLHKFR